MKQRYIIVGVIIIVLFTGFLIVKSKELTSKTNNSNQPRKQRSVLPKEVTIQLTKEGFTPQKITIQEGTTVRWKNISGNKQTVNSDDFPTNQLHKELNFGIFNNGSSVVYTFTKPGEYGYHNQLRPQQKGNVIVTN